MLLETCMVRTVIQLYLYQGFWIISEKTDGTSREYVERFIKITFDTTDSLFRFEIFISNTILCYHQSSNKYKIIVI